MYSDKGLIKSEEEVALIRISCKIASQTLAYLSRFLQPGVSTLKLDKLAEEFICDHRGAPAFKNYRPDPDHNPYPCTLCTSLNDEVVHGLPSDKKILKEGDILSIDCGVFFNGYYGDLAYSFLIGRGETEKTRFLGVTLEALYKGIEMAREGGRVGDISYAVQQHVEMHGYSVVKEMGGHGIGKRLHEPPEIPNYGVRGRGNVLQAGMTLAIEPISTMGSSAIFKKNDGWTLVTRDKSLSSHFEHTILVKKEGAEILTNFDF